MSNFSSLLTPEVESNLLGFIRAGGYPHVAAEAAGIPGELFTAWLERGRRRGAREPYKSFYRRVQQAIATARLKAEFETITKNPFYWLRHGPGRETPESPGWTNPVKPALAGNKGARCLRTRAWGRLWQRVLKALEPFPEARLAVAEAIEKPKPEPPVSRGQAIPGSPDDSP
jgi:hypothetical protein